MSPQMDSVDLARHWQIDPRLTLLNHGSFGATPTVVLQQQRLFLDALEADPIAFLAPERDLERKLDQVRNILARFVGAAPDRLAFVRNATDGVNAVLRSFRWQRYDEILVTNHGYNACTNAAKFVADRYELNVVEALIPFPIATSEQVLESVEKAFSPRTRLLLIDHVTSPTGLVFPIEQIVELAHQKNVRVLVDGAHAPGMVPLALDQLAADYYTANHHKWVCAPKVSGFLYVQPQWQKDVHPTVISHAANRPRHDRSRFIAEFDWTGTFDPSPLLAVPRSLEFLGSLYPGGIVELQNRNRGKTLAGRQALLDDLQIDCPAPSSMIGSLATIPLSADRFGGDILKTIQGKLYNQFRIELPIFPHIEKGRTDDRLLRFAMQAYNDHSQIEKLVTVLKQLLGSKM